MKILQICSASDYGGGEKHVADLVRALASRGHAVYMVVRPDSPLREPLAGVIASWHELPLKNSLDVYSARAIADLVERHGIHIIHAHVGRDYLVAALASRRTPQSRLIVTRHHYLPLKNNPVYRWLLGKADAFIAVSETVRQTLLERLALDPERVQVIPNWIDTAKFQPIDRDQARAMFQIRANLAVACIGQLRAEKGQEELIRAAGQLCRTRSDVEFLIAGEEQADAIQFTDHLHQVVETLGIRERVRFLGFVQYVPELLAAVDVVVVPSWDEGFSLVTLEAMAARRAVLASNVGGIKGIVQENVNGLLCPPRDANALAEKLKWLLADAPLRDRLAGQGQREVYERYSRDKVIDQIEALYREVLKA
ncbi:MAG: glycosyltransferase family 4 protein [Acidobacteria bacterium]|nr:glycosyltransferase family 4 protein [Acidobacteriota bacterium]